jgi:hypothetical protein
MQIREFPVLNLNRKYFTIITIIIINCCGLGPSRTVPLDLEDGFRFFIFVLVSPDHDARSGRRLSVILVTCFFHFCWYWEMSQCLLLVTVYERFCLSVSPFWLGLQVVSKLSPVLLIISLHIFTYLKSEHLKDIYGLPSV